MPFGALLGLGVGLVGAGIRANAAAQQARAQRLAAEAKNEANRFNMKILEDNAKSIENDMAIAKTAGFQQEADFYKRISQVIGTQAAQMGASGAIMGSGSFAFAFRDTNVQGMEDLSRIRQASNFKQLQLQRQAANERQKAEQILMGGEHEGPSIGMAVATSLIGNLGSVASSFMSAMPSKTPTSSSFTRPAINSSPFTRPTNNFISALGG